jgi:hypothetical protein
MERKKARGRRVFLDRVAVVFFMVGFFATRSIPIGEAIVHLPGHPAAESEKPVVPDFEKSSQRRHDSFAAMQSAANDAAS